MKNKKENLPDSDRRRGGGILESKKNPGKLQKFKPNNKQKKIIIGSIIVLFLLVGGITLYRTFALYEEKKEFNALKGIVPNFAKINIIAIVDGEEVQTIPDKKEYSVESVSCDKENIGIWDEENWRVKVEKPNDPEITCTVEFSFDEFKRLATIINSTATNMGELLANATDVDKMVANKEAMTLIINSDTLKKDLKGNTNYTVANKKKILNSTVLTETQKSNAGLPYYVFKQSKFNNLAGGFNIQNSNPRYSENSSCKNSYNDYGNWHNSFVNCKGSLQNLVSKNAINVTSYSALELYVEHWRNCQGYPVNGSLYVGIGDANVSSNFANTGFSFDNLNRATRYLTFNISGYSGNYYLKMRLQHNGSDPNCGVGSNYLSVALY